MNLNLQNMMTLIKQNLCPHFQEMFSFKDNLQWHLWTHTGEKLYICQECGVGLLQHMFLQIHIKTTEEKPLEIIGNKQFGSKTNWNINLSWKITTYKKTKQWIHLFYDQITQEYFLKDNFGLWLFLGSDSSSEICFFD